MIHLFNSPTAAGTRNKEKSIDGENATGEEMLMMITSTDHMLLSTRMSYHIYFSEGQFEKTLHWVTIWLGLETGSGTQDGNYFQDVVDCPVSLTLCPKHLAGLYFFYFLLLFTYFHFLWLPLITSSIIVTWGCFFAFNISIFDCIVFPQYRIF